MPDDKYGYKGFYNPNDYMGILSSGLSGATVGSKFGPTGAAIGGLAGTSIGTIGAWQSASLRKRQEEEDAKLKAELDAIHNRFRERLAQQQAAGARRGQQVGQKAATQAELAGLSPGQSLALQNEMQNERVRAEAQRLPGLAMQSAQEEALLRKQKIDEAIARQDLAERQSADIWRSVGSLLDAGGKLAGSLKDYQSEKTKKSEGEDQAQDSASRVSEALKAAGAGVAAATPAGAKQAKRIGTSGRAAGAAMAAGPRPGPPQGQDEIDKLAESIQLKQSAPTGASATDWIAANIEMKPSEAKIATIDYRPLLDEPRINMVAAKGTEGNVAVVEEFQKQYPGYDFNSPQWEAVKQLLPESQRRQLDYYGSY